MLVPGAVSLDLGIIGGLLDSKLARALSDLHQVSSAVLATLTQIIMLVVHKLPTLKICTKSQTSLELSVLNKKDFS